MEMIFITWRCYQYQRKRKVVYSNEELWWDIRDLNPVPTDYESAALTK